MTSTQQQKDNLTDILKKASVLIDRNKAEAVKRGDIAQSIGLANRQAEMERYFRERGVDISEPEIDDFILGPESSFRFILKIPS